MQILLKTWYDVTHRTLPQHLFSSGSGIGTQTPHLHQGGDSGLAIGTPGLEMANIISLT